MSKQKKDENKKNREHKHLGVRENETKKIQIKDEDDEEERVVQAQQGPKEELPGSSRTDSSKRLRFELPAIHALSDESFSSALSQAPPHESDIEDFEDFTKLKPQISILQKFLSSRITYSQPRKAVGKMCIYDSSEFEVLDALDVSSSRQLYEGDTPTPSDANIGLIKATFLRKLNAVKEALDNGANVNTVTENMTPLLIATEIGDDRLVAYLLTVPNINPDFQNKFGQTPLIIAVRNAFVEIVRLLLNHNADVNIADNIGKTPLHSALFQQRPNLVKLLLAYGADVEKPDCFGERPIYTSTVKKPHMECLITLLKMGAAVNYINFSGLPLLSRTILNHTEFSMIETLVEYGASVNAPDLVSKKTPLHFAALSNDFKVAKYLISRGADTRLLTTYNFTPLDEAIFQNSKEIADYIMGLKYKKKEVQIVTQGPQKSKSKNKRKF